MQLSLSEEQLMIQETARRFAENELTKNIEALDRGAGREPFIANIKSLADLGFMGLNIRADYGGTESGVISFALAITEISRVCPSTAVTTSINNMVAEVIQAIGSEAQRRQYLPKICSGEYAAASFCLTESNAGSDPAAMRTSAERDGDHWVLNGSKAFITSGEEAGCFVVWAVTDPSAPKGKGISCFIVDADTPGIHVGKAEKKMGQIGSNTNPITFENCRIPADALMGTESQGFKIAVGELAGGRIGVASLALGIGQAAMDYARSYLGEREQFGQKIANFQGLQWMLAERYTELEAARLLIMQAAYCKEQGLDYGTSASMAKLFASEKANDACYTAIQLMGGAGYIREYPVERMARDVRVTSIYEGTSEIQKVIIARDLLKDVV
jgi:alkylation response protein AidB-like acyl-CoA dehydrogenase